MRNISVIASSAWNSHFGFDYNLTPSSSEFLSLKKHSIKACVWGSGTPIVVLPGLAGGMDLLAPFIHELSKDFQVFSYQYLGEESGFTFRNDFHFNDLVDDLNSILGYWGLEKPHLCGLSFGGALSLNFAAKYPNKIASLIVQGAGASYERGMVQRLASLILSHYQLPHHNPLVNQFFRLFTGGQKLADSQINGIAKICWETDQTIIAKRLRLLKNFNLAKINSALKAPSLFLRGQKDPLTSPQNFAALESITSYSKSVTLKDLGHLAFIQSPTTLKGHIMKFVQELENDFI